ncbi:hypothetical protein C5167_042208, partial [Papaver somniferum]
MGASEKKIMSTMNFLVNEVGYEILVSKGLIKERISKSFLEKFVTRYEQEVPELMKIFQGPTVTSKMKIYEFELWNQRMYTSAR